MWQPAWIAYSESATAYRDQIESGDATGGVAGLPPFPTLSGPAPVAPGALMGSAEAIGGKQPASRAARRSRLQPVWFRRSFAAR